LLKVILYNTGYETLNLIFVQENSRFQPRLLKYSVIIYSRCCNTIYVIQCTY